MGKNRNKSQDIISQKQSDATLGYERGLRQRKPAEYIKLQTATDAYDGKRYKPVTDDNMYAQPISGYIERAD